MKTRIMIKSLRLSLLTVFFMMISVSGYSQACPGNLETVSLANFTQTATTVEFDYMISNTGSTTMNLNALSCNVLYNSGMLPAGATGTVTLVSGPNDLDFPGHTNGTASHNATVRGIRYAGIPNSTSPTPINTTPKKYARVRFTSTLPWTSNTAATFTINPTNGTPAGAFGTSSAVYCNGNTNSVALTVVLGTLTLGGPYNYTLNPVTDTCFTSGSESNVTNVTCFGETNGSATITMDPVPSNLAATYSIDGGASTPVTLTAGGSFDVTGLNVGVHTITVTGSGTCTTPVDVPVTITGPTSQPTNTTTETACDTYTWSVNGQTYTTSGTYTGTSTDGNGCTVNETLELTINNSTSSTETIAACDTYTWAANGTTYTTSGTYTNVTTNAAGCPDTATLVLTINNSTSSTETIAACDTYTWAANGTTYTTSGTYTNVTTNAAGCPDTATLELTINTSTVYYADADGDTFGDATGNPVSLCTPEMGFVTNNEDCDDNNPAVNPNATEIAYDGIDNDCDGSIDEGFPPLTTKLKPTSCGATLAGLLSTISANQVIGASGYRYKVTNGLDVQYFESTYPWFNLGYLANYDYATTYTVEVELKMSGDWLGYYGDACTVTTPAIPASYVSFDSPTCGSTLASVETLLLMKAVPRATGYRFEVTHGTTTEVLDTTNPYFRLQQLPSGYVYGTTYSVRIAVRTGGSGVYTAYGTPCSFTTPAVPQIAQCGTTLAPGNIASVSSLRGVTTYTFEVTTPTAEVITINRSVPYFIVNSISVPGYTATTQYFVRVSLTTAGGVSPWGDSCSINPAAAAVRYSNTTVSSELKVQAFPNPFTNNFTLDITRASDENVSVMVYDMIGKLLDTINVNATDNSLELGTNYPSGVYNVIVAQGEKVESVRMIKR